MLFSIPSAEGKSDEECERFTKLYLVGLGKDFSEHIDNARNLVGHTVEEEIELIKQMIMKGMGN
jgi:hypothetical protein